MAGATAPRAVEKETRLHKYIYIYIYICIYNIIYIYNIYIISYIYIYTLYIYDYICVYTHDTLHGLNPIGLECKLRTTRLPGSIAEPTQSLGPRTLQLPLHSGIAFRERVQLVAAHTDMICCDICERARFQSVCAFASTILLKPLDVQERNLTEDAHFTSHFHLGS